MRVSSGTGSPPSARTKRPLSMMPLSRRCVDAGRSSISPRNNVPPRPCSSSPGEPAVPSSAAAVPSSGKVRLSSAMKGPAAVGPDW